VSEKKNAGHGNPVTSAALGALQPVTKYKKGLVEMAEAVGYQPGEFAMQRLSSDIVQVRAWIDDLNHDLVPADFSSLTIQEARSEVQLLVEDIEQRDKEWRDYFFPKLRSVEATVGGPDDGPVEMTVRFVKPPGESQ
jgi:hypothetical protein